MRALAYWCLAVFVCSLCAVRPAEAEDAGAAVRHGRYRGTAAVTIQYCDVDAAGDMTCSGKKTFRRSITAEVGPPVKCESVREKNAFHLNISADQDPADPQDGEFWLYSSGTTRAMWSGCALLQYWSLKLKDDRLTGALVDTHAAEGAAHNRLWATLLMPGGAEMVWPYPIQKGATLRGTLTGEALKVKVEGNSTDESRLFVLNVSARRSK